MASEIRLAETSAQSGIPVELYRFTHGDAKYLYTSADYNIIVPMDDGTTESYFPDVVQRDNIIPDSSGTVETVAVHVPKDHAIAKLYQGAPPEESVLLEVQRFHLGDLAKRDIVLRGTVSQVKFSGSECELTVSIQQWLDKELPNGMIQYYCPFSLFDHNCKLNKANYSSTITIDSGEGLNVRSPDLANMAEGTLNGGRFYYEGHVRMIDWHIGDTIKLKYPLPVKVYPLRTATVTLGCDGRFSTCALKFNNSSNFGGVPYCPPTDPEKNPTGVGAYWIDALVVKRDTDGFIGTITGV